MFTDSETLLSVDRIVVLAETLPPADDQEFPTVEEAGEEGVGVIGPLYEALLEPSARRLKCHDDGDDDDAGTAVLALLTGDDGAIDFDTFCVFACGIECWQSGELSG
jgi:hypothetical protein